VIKGNYNYNSFKEDIRNLFEKSAVKPGKPMALIITDGQIIKEQFLICINDFLNSGYIPELMPEVEYIAYARLLKNKAKSEG
jgi:dynein heavy chain